MNDKLFILRHFVYSGRTIEWNINLLKLKKDFYVSQRDNMNII